MKGEVDFDDAEELMEHREITGWEVGSDSFNLSGSIPRRGVLLVAVAGPATGSWRIFSWKVIEVRGKPFSQPVARACDGYQQHAEAGFFI